MKYKVLLAAAFCFAATGIDAANSRAINRALSGNPTAEKLDTLCKALPTDQGKLKELAENSPGQNFPYKYGVTLDSACSAGARAEFNTLQAAQAAYHPAGGARVDGNALAFVNAMTDYVAAGGSTALYADDFAAAKALIAAGGGRGGGGGGNPAADLTDNTIGALQRRFAGNTAAGTYSANGSFARAISNAFDTWATTAQLPISNVVPADGSAATTFANWTAWINGDLTDATTVRNGLHGIIIGRYNSNDHANLGDSVQALIQEAQRLNAAGGGGGGGADAALTTAANNLKNSFAVTPGQTTAQFLDLLTTQIGRLGGNGNIGGSYTLPTVNSVTDFFDRVKVYVDGFNAYNTAINTQAGNYGVAFAGGATYPQKVQDVVDAAEAAGRAAAGGGGGGALNINATAAALEQAVAQHNAAVNAQDINTVRNLYTTAVSRDASITLYGKEYRAIASQTLYITSTQPLWVATWNALQQAANQLKALQVQLLRGGYDENAQGNLTRIQSISKVQNSTNTGDLTPLAVGTDLIVPSGTSAATWNAGTCNAYVVTLPAATA